MGLDVDKKVVLGESFLRPATRTEQVAPRRSASPFVPMATHCLPLLERRRPLRGSALRFGAAKARCSHEGGNPCEKSRRLQHARWVFVLTSSLKCLCDQLAKRLAGNCGLLSAMLKTAP